MPAENAVIPNGVTGEGRNRHPPLSSSAAWLRELSDQLRGSTAPIKLLIVILLIFSMFEYLSSGLLRPMLYIGTDFPSLYVAAGVARNGQNLYDQEVFKETSTELGFGKSAKPYVYHPLFAYLLIPLTFFDPQIANALFAFLNLFLFFAIVWFSTPRDCPQRFTVLVLGLILAANFGAIHDSARLGRVDLYVALYIILALYFMRNSRPWLGGAMVGLATMLKSTPGLLLVYFLWKRQWRALAAGILACAIFLGLGYIVAGPETNAMFWKGITAGSVLPSLRTDDPLVAEIMDRSFEGSETLSEFLDRLPPSPRNLSFHGLGRHLFDSDLNQVLLSDPALARWLGIGLSLLLLLSMFWLTRKPLTGPLAATQLELEYGLVVTTLMLVAPITWRYHMVALLLPLLILARRTLELPLDRRYWKPWLVYSVCYAGLAANYGWVAGLESGIGPLFMTTRTAFALALYGLLAWWLFNDRKFAPDG